MAIFGRRLALSPPSPAPAADDSTIPPQGPAGGQNADVNLDNILKLIPGEVIAPFMTGAGLSVPLLADQPWLWPTIVFVICFLLCGFLRATATKPAGTSGWLDGVNWPLVYVSLVAFFIWAHAVNDKLWLVTYLPSAVWSFFALLWGIIAPKLVPRAEQIRGDGL